jgi:hypothetical protein
MPNEKLRLILTEFQNKALASGYHSCGSLVEDAEDLAQAQSEIIKLMVPSEFTLEMIIEESKLYQGFQCEHYTIKAGLKKQLAQAIHNFLEERL